MNRRSLLKRLGAAVVAAPAVAIVASRPVEAANDEAVREACAQGYNRGYDVASARAESRAAEYTNGFPRYVARQLDEAPWAGWAPHVEWVALKPNSIQPINGDVVAVLPHSVGVLRHQPGECADCDWYR